MLKSFPSKFQEAWQCLLGDGVELHSLPWALLTLCPRRSQELYEALMVDGDDDGAEPAGEQMAQAPRSLPPEVRAREPESPRAREPDLKGLVRLAPQAKAQAGRPSMPYCKALQSRGLSDSLARGFDGRRTRLDGLAHAPAVSQAQIMVRSCSVLITIVKMSLSR